MLSCGSLVPLLLLLNGVSGRPLECDLKIDSTGPSSDNYLLSELIDRSMGITHTALWVSDPDETRWFYDEVLGFDLLFEFTRDGVDSFFIGRDDGHMIQFMHDSDAEGPPSTDRSGLDHFAISTNNVDRTVDSLMQNAGNPVVEEPTTIENLGVRVAFVEDPDGYVIELVQQLGEE